MCKRPVYVWVKCTFLTAVKGLWLWPPLWTYMNVERTDAVPSALSISTSLTFCRPYKDQRDVSLHRSSHQGRRSSKISRSRRICKTCQSSSFISKTCAVLERLTWEQNNWCQITQECLSKSNYWKSIMKFSPINHDKRYQVSAQKLHPPRGGCHKQRWCIEPQDSLELWTISSKYNIKHTRKDCTLFCIIHHAILMA